MAESRCAFLLNGETVEERKAKKDAASRKRYKEKHGEGEEVSKKEMNGYKTLKSEIVKFVKDHNLKTDSWGIKDEQKFVAVIVRVWYKHKIEFKKETPNSFKEMVEGALPHLSKVNLRWNILLHPHKLAYLKEYHDIRAHRREEFLESMDVEVLRDFMLPEERVSENWDEIGADNERELLKRIHLQNGLFSDFHYTDWETVQNQCIMGLSRGEGKPMNTLADLDVKNLQAVFMNKFQGNWTALEAYFDFEELEEDFGLQDGLRDEYDKSKSLWQKDTSNVRKGLNAIDDNELFDGLNYYFWIQLSLKFNRSGDTLQYRKAIRYYAQSLPNKLRDEVMLKIGDFKNQTVQFLNDLNDKNHELIFECIKKILSNNCLSEFTSDVHRTLYDEKPLLEDIKKFHNQVLLSIQNLLEILVQDENAFSVLTAMDAYVFQQIQTLKAKKESHVNRQLSILRRGFRQMEDDSKKQSRELNPEEIEKMVVKPGSGSYVDQGTFWNFNEEDRFRKKAAAECRFSKQFTLRAISNQEWTILLTKAFRKDMGGSLDKPETWDLLLKTVNIPLQKKGLELAKEYRENVWPKIQEFVNGEALQYLLATSVINIVNM